MVRWLDGFGKPGRFLWGEGERVDPGDVAFWLSIAATLIAAFAALVGYAVYRQQADPDVIVYAEADVERQTMINLVAENIGNAPAKNDLPSTSQSNCRLRPGVCRSTPPGEPDTMTEGPLVRGIPFLPPGGRRVVTWGQYGGLRKALGDRAVSVTEYQGAHLVLPWPRRLKSRAFSRCSPSRPTTHRTGTSPSRLLTTSRQSERASLVSPAARAQGLGSLITLLKAVARRPFRDAALALYCDCKLT